MEVEANRETERLRAELDQYKKEKDKIREAIGQIGGKRNSRIEHSVDAIALVLVLLLFIVDMAGQFIGKPIIPHNVSIELGLLLVSLKIIWMMYRQSKVEHFQFWILHSIEFRLNDLSQEMMKLRKKIDKKD